MREIIKEGKKLPFAPYRYIIKCRKCGCKFTYDFNDIERPHCIDFWYLRYVKCPQCEHDVQIKKLKIFKTKKSILKAK